MRRIWVRQSDSSEMLCFYKAHFGKADYCNAVKRDRWEARDYGAKKGVFEEDKGGLGLLQELLFPSYYASGNKSRIFNESHSQIGAVKKKRGEFGC